MHIREQREAAESEIGASGQIAQRAQQETVQESNERGGIFFRAPVRRHKTETRDSRPTATANTANMATSYWLFVISSLLVLAAADVNHLDAGQDPVLRRLAIPAQAANANDGGGGGGDSLSQLDLISLGELKGEEEEQQEQEEQQEAQEAEEEEETLPSVKRLWGVPDATAEAGRPFDLTLPSDAFEGHVSRYEVGVFFLIYLKYYFGDIFRPEKNGETQKERERERIKEGSV